VLALAIAPLRIPDQSVAGHDRSTPRPVRATLLAAAAAAATAALLAL